MPNAAKGDAIWETHLVKLKEYKCRHGDCTVPIRWAEDPRLGRWVMTQRGCKKNLDRGDPRPKITAARVAKLDLLGFAWQVSAAELIKQNGKGQRGDAGWDLWLVKIKAYKQHHGDCNVPQVWVADPRLGKWVNKQRQYKKALDRGDPSKGMTAARVAKLDALDFTWEMSAAQLSKQKRNARRDDAGWEAQVAKLERYKHEHGDCSVPKVWAEDPPLGQWVHRQRGYKKKLDRGDPSYGMTAARAAKLEKLGFAWELSAAEIGKQHSIEVRGDAGWDLWLSKLKQYKWHHGDCNVPQGWVEDPTLGTWVHNQRVRKKNLDRGDTYPRITVARVAKLEALGFAWGISAAEISKQHSTGIRDDGGWDLWLSKLKQYKQRHGDYSVPNRWAEDPQLGRWVHNQRQYKKNLDRGDSYPRITAARVAKLDLLGFAWEISAAAISKQNGNARRDDAGWEVQLAKLKEYKHVHGGCNVPQGWAEDPALANWVQHQRASKRLLDRGKPSEGVMAARVAKLDALSFVWEKRYM
jgi:hypothetical protein